MQRELRGDPRYARMVSYPSRIASHLVEVGMIVWSAKGQLTLTELGLKKAEKPECSG